MKHIINHYMCFIYVIMQQQYTTIQFKHKISNSYFAYLSIFVVNIIVII
jgi:hypothetical protein